MEKEQRSRLQKATQDARRLLEEEFRSQLLQTYDIDVEKVRWAEEPGAHLLAEQRLIREMLIAWIEHRSAQINDRREALLLALREMAFTALNRFVALKLMEARELVRPCVSGGLESAGFLEFTAVAQGLLADQDSSYRLYLETIFEDVSRELRALFDPRDPASLLWPKRTALLELLEILNRPELSELWIEDETLGWVYQYFNGNDVKEMRDAVKGGAPRNSRELAVRNQFFTPRYVVEFLADNTLGRIWYEMCQGKTGLKDYCRYLVRRPNEIWLQPGAEAAAEAVADEALSQEELLRQPVHIPHRQLKDPREIRMLDPACGSMHFGLYAFDLYLVIYEEAWEIAQASGGKAQLSETFTPFVEYAEAFADKASFLREVPRLILLHNIHGIDIDPRATQIARLTLWLRAQREWQAQKTEIRSRPAIARSNVVCAEPMPGERGLLADFVDQQFPVAERRLVQQLLEAVFDKMQLAGEAGALLKIEEEIREAIDEARREWRKLDILQQDLFSPAEMAALVQMQTPTNADIQDVSKDFWIGLEEKIYSALQEYAELSENAGGFQRRLFAQDAVHGFAFIDLCRKRYDVAVMNPPFGECSEPSRGYLQERYPGTYKNIFSSFIDRIICQQNEQGLIGAVTSRTFLFLPDYEFLRGQCLLTGERLSCCSELGEGVLDNATVRVAATVIRKTPSPESIWFTRLTETDVSQKGQVLLSEVEQLVRGESSDLGFLISPNLFRGLPGKVFAYTTAEHLLRLFSGFPSLQPEYGWVRRVPGTGENEAVLRLRFEVPANELAPLGSWCPYAKGGPFSPFYGDCDLVIQACNASEISSPERTKGLTLKAKPKSEDLFGAPSLTFSYANDFGLDVRPLRAGSLFDSGGPIIFPCDYTSRWWLLGLLNTRIIRRLLFVLTPERFKQVGLVQSLPISSSTSEILAQEAKLAACAKAEMQTYDETSPIFTKPIVLSSSGLNASILATVRACLHSELALWEAFERMDASAFKAFGLHAQQTDRVIKEVGCIPVEYQEDRPASRFDNAFLVQAGKEVGKGDLTCSYQSTGYLERIAHGTSSNARLLAESESVVSALAVAKSHYFAAALLSWLVGVTFGRWSINMVYLDAQPIDPDSLFEILPICPTGQMQNVHGFPACPEDVCTSYPAQISWEGILVDDPNHPLDIKSQLSHSLGVIWCNAEGESAHVIEKEACEILGIERLRDWLRSPSNFFADHLKRYSKSRRQAPVYWQLSAGNGNYSIWLYYHRLTADTLYHILRVFVEPRIQEVEREQYELETQGPLPGEAVARLHDIHLLLGDLRILENELDFIAPLWNPNLNDGVIINHAILWRITPYAPWQKKCKECWDKLVKGDYDWAHLAFHLWPERVIPKCTTDRSLAIAHGLEERLWQETNNGNWLPRQLSEADLQSLIAEHSKPAVKNALERFLAAPPPVAPTRTRTTRATRSSTSGTTRKPRGTATVVDAEASRQTLLALTAAPAEGLSRNAIAELLGVEAASLTAVIKQLKEGGQIEQLGAARGARYVLSEQGRAAVTLQAEYEP